MSKDLEKLIQTVLPKNSLIVFQVQDGKVEEFAEALGGMKKLFNRYGIEAITCPKSVTITILPSGTDPSQVHVHPKGYFN